MNTIIAKQAVITIDLFYFFLNLCEIKGTSRMQRSICHGSDVFTSTTQHHFLPKASQSSLNYFFLLQFSKL